MPQIHPTAVVESGAQLADDVVVGPLCYVGPNVKMASGNRLLNQATVMGNTTLGPNNTIWSHAVIGADPQDLKYDGENSALEIGTNNIFRESVTVHLGTANGGGITKVGDNGLFMVGCHIAHDCLIGNHIIIANNAMLAGHVHVSDHVIISGGAGLHHFVTAGEYCYIGGNSRIIHDAPPFMVIEGHPSRVRGYNKVGMQRYGFSPESIANIKDAYRRLYGGKENGSANTTAVLAALEAEYPSDQNVNRLIQFVRDISNGHKGRILESKRADNPSSNPAR